MLKLLDVGTVTKFLTFWGLGEKEGLILNSGWLGTFSVRSRLTLELPEIYLSCLLSAGIKGLFSFLFENFVQSVSIVFLLFSCNFSLSIDLILEHELLASGNQPHFIKSFESC